VGSSVYEDLEVAQHRQKGPSVWDSATELPRILLEVTSLAYSWPILAGAPRGDGHAVMVLPGFTAGDESTLVLRRYLSRLNYDVLPWEQGQNNGSFELQEQLVQHFYLLTRKLDHKITLIGQSLGGVFARALGRQFPDHVRQVITLGSPFSSQGPEATNAVVARLFQYMSGMTAEEMRDQMLVPPEEPMPVPSTAIYSKSDGVVHWSSCLDYEGAETENIEIIGSHSGMAHNPLVFHVLADRLAQPEGSWRPFERTGGCRSLVFPEPQKRPKSCAS
jgi:pimeloyl-ACP methyl ester carboxylesterase